MAGDLRHRWPMTTVITPCSADCIISGQMKPLAAVKFLTY